VGLVVGSAATITITAWFLPLSLAGRGTVVLWVLLCAAVYGATGWAVRAMRWGIPRTHRFLVLIAAGCAAAATAVPARSHRLSWTWTSGPQQGQEVKLVRATHGGVTYRAVELPVSDAPSGTHTMGHRSATTELNARPWCTSQELVLWVATLSDAVSATADSQPSGREGLRLEIRATTGGKPHLLKEVRLDAPATSPSRGWQSHRLEIPPRTAKLTIEVNPIGRITALQGARVRVHSDKLRPVWRGIRILPVLVAADVVTVGFGVLVGALLLWNFHPQPSPVRRTWASGLRQAWSVRHALVTVLLVGGTIRLWGLGALPLIINNDSYVYLQQAMGIYEGRPVGFSNLRRCGYPLFLCGVFHFCGVGPTGILVSQIVLGCLSAVLLTVTACRLSNPILGTVIGLVYSLDPFPFLFEHYALTETTATCLAITATSLTLLCGPGRYVGRVVLGLVLSAGMHVRPNFVVLVPFHVLGSTFAGPASRGTRAGHLGAVLIGLAVGLISAPSGAPSGPTGSEARLGAMAWTSLLRLGLVDPERATDQRLEEAFRPLAGRVLSDEEVWGFLHRTADVPGRDAPLLKWAAASVMSQPRAYLQAVLHAMAWQLEWFPSSSPLGYSEARWNFRRLAQDGSNYAFTGPPAPMQPFGMNGRGGAFRAILRWWSEVYPGGVPQAPLCVAAVAMLVLAVSRRDGALAWVFAGTLVFFLVHAVLLMPCSRYTLPAWGVWYLAVSGIPGHWMRYGRTSGPAMGQPPLAP